MKFKKENLKKLAIPGLLLLGAGALLYTFRSVKIPSHVQVLENFDVEKYTGEWYEIARFDFKQEKHMKNVTANYTLQPDGSIEVINRGYHMVDEEWREAKGKAIPNGEPGQSALKVSFFGPFYAGYNVVKISGGYRHALVFGESRDYIWILSRSPTIPAATKKRFLEYAMEAGYDLERLVWTEHDVNNEGQKEEPEKPEGGNAPEVTSD